MVVNFALNLWVKDWFISHILYLFQMIETNDISEEKIKMKQTMEGMKLLFLLGTACSSDLYAFSSSNFLLLQGWLHGRGLGSHFICQNLLDDICCLALFFPSNQAEHMQGWMLLPVLDILQTDGAGCRQIWGNRCVYIPSLIFTAGKIQTLNVICSQERSDNGRY